MTDRETVATWLEICGVNDDCSGCCPYGDDGETSDCRTKLMADALALLKEKEIKQGRWKSVQYKKARICSVCEKDEPYKFADDDSDVYDFCPHCGAKMEKCE